MERVLDRELGGLVFSFGFISFFEYFIGFFLFILEDWWEKK